MLLTRRELFGLPALFSSATTVLGANTLPNLVVIFCDDLGYGDLGCYGGKIPTPNLDRLAAEGIRFTHFYSTNPVCSPSRASLLTGRYPTRVGVPRVFFPPDQHGLNTDEQTLADLLKTRQYKTACVGKWHLGHTAPYLPTRRGFDSYFGIPYSNDMVPRLLLRDSEVLEQMTDLDTLTPRYTEEAVRFIDNAKGSPFFLYMPHTYPHIPLGASAKFKGKSRHGIYGDVVEEIDWSVGEVVKALERNQLRRNTLILFSSDNGPWFQGSAGPLRGRKGHTFEGGVRVPCIMSMPGRIPKHRVSHAITSTLDLVPTFAKLAGAPMPVKPVDGIDLWPLLSGKSGTLDRPEPFLYFHDQYLLCARWKQWKLHVARFNHTIYSPPPAEGRKIYRLVNPELYDLGQDPDESYDVAALHSDVIREIQGHIDRLMPGFPPEIVQAWHEQQARPAAPVPAGAITRAPSP